MNAGAVSHFRFLRPTGPALQYSLEVIYDPDG